MLNPDAAHFSTAKITLFRIEEQDLFADPPRVVDRQLKRDVFHRGGDGEGALRPVYGSQLCLCFAARRPPCGYGFHLCALCLHIVVAVSQLRRPLRGLLLPGDNARQRDLRVFFAQSADDLRGI